MQHYWDKDGVLAGNRLTERIRTDSDFGFLKSLEERLHGTDGHVFHKGEVLTNPELDRALSLVFSREWPLTPINPLNFPKGITSGFKITEWYPCGKAFGWNEMLTFYNVQTPPGADQHIADVLCSTENLRLLEKYDLCRGWSVLRPEGPYVREDSLR